MSNGFYNNKVFVEKIENKMANDFMDEHNKNGSVKGKFGITSIGLFRDNILSAVIQLSSPRSKKAKKYYSTEIIKVAFTKNSYDIHGFQKMIDFCIQNFYPADMIIFVASENTTLKNVLENTGFKPSNKLPEAYAWFNPNISFYTYKITATDSNKYYYGVSSVKKPYKGLTVQDCLEHKYFGSGGSNENNKFKNWKKKHKATLKKEIIDTFDRKSYAYTAEKELIGDSWKNDKLCLNSVAGGMYIAFAKDWTGAIFEKECLIHGLTKHRGNACYKCFMNKLVSEQVCEIHGLTKFQGDSCAKCSIGKTFIEKECPVHGLTVFSGKHCRKCSVEKTVNMKECPIHGLTKHQGNVCNSCNALSSISLKICKIHGETKFTGDRCRKCISASNNTMKECSYHGLSNYRGEKCMKCSAQKGKHNRGEHRTVSEMLCYLCDTSKS